MLDLMKDLLIVSGRIITIIPLLFFMTLFMGKRAIAELPVFDFLIVIILGALVGADIADPEINHIPTAYAIIAIALFQRIVANWKISNRKIGRLLTFEPTVVIQDGKFIHKNLKQIRYSIDNILQLLREKDVFDISEVETAVVEPSGGLSVLKKPEKQNIKVEDMYIATPTSSISFPVIVEGKIYPEVLKEVHLNEPWLIQHLADQGIDNVEEIFFASINRKLELHISLRNDEDNTSIPPILH